MFIFILSILVIGLNLLILPGLLRHNKTLSREIDLWKEPYARLKE